MTRERALEMADEAIRAMFARLSPAPTSCIADTIVAAVAEERERRKKTERYDQVIEERRYQERDADIAAAVAAEREACAKIAEGFSPPSSSILTPQACGEFIARRIRAGGAKT